MALNSIKMALHSVKPEWNVTCWFCFAWGISLSSWTGAGGVRETVPSKKPRARKRERAKGIQVPCTLTFSHARRRILWFTFEFSKAVLIESTARNIAA